MSTSNAEPAISGDAQGSDAEAESMASLGEKSAKLSDRSLELRFPRGWRGRLEYVVSMLGYAVGFGNIWRFPYLCYRNGGGAFLILFLLMLAIVGIPLFFMEVCLGQFSSCGTTNCWEFAPLFKGVGLAMLVFSGLVSIYYNVILAYSFFYLFASFTSSLPWSTCTNVWNTAYCSLKHPQTKCDNGTQYANGTCYTGTEYRGVWEETLFRTVAGVTRTSASEEYWNNYVLGLSDRIDKIGSPRWNLALCLLLAWVLCFVGLIGILLRYRHKVVYFTTLFPFVMLVIFFLRGVTLENAAEGLYFYFVPRWERLGDSQVWRDAAVQIFYSMGPGWGGLIVMASYNRFHNNALMDSLVVSLAISLTSVFGGFIIFSCLGYMASKLNVDIENVIKSGAGVAFIVYAEAAASLPLPTLWAILSFCMFITLGLNSQLAQLETIVLGIQEQFPHLRPRRFLIIIIICIIMFLLGLPFTCPGGVYWLQLIDNYSVSWSLLVICFTENIAIVFIYGIKRFLQDLKTMFGKEPSIWWKICWMGLSPVTIAFIFLFSLIRYSPAKYDSYVYPPWVQAMGWIIALPSILTIPAFMIYIINQEDKADTLWEKIKLLVLPTRSWGPLQVGHRQLVKHVEGFVLDPKAEEADPCVQAESV